MKRRTYCCALLFCCVSILSCTTNEELTTRGNPDNLFLNADDTTLFQSKTDVTTDLSADSAFNASTVVAIGRPSYIDSTMHGEEDAHFYLVAAVIDSVLKGPLRSAKKVFFAARNLPLFPPREQKIVIYLSPLDKKRRLLASELYWQWTEHAQPIVYTAPVPDTLNTVIKNTRKHYHAKKRKRRRLK